jgi:hypothetical protein
MTTAPGGYAHGHRWVKHVLGSTHTTIVVTVAWAGLGLLVAHRVTAAALARAFPAQQAGAGRSWLRRVRRWWRGPALEQAALSPALRRLARTLLAAAQPVVVALDTTRRGPWAGWVAGSVGAGRTLPSGWAGLPSPWPTGRCRAGPRWPLVADRGLPSAALCAQWRDGSPDLRVRWRWSAWGTGDRVSASGRAPRAAGRRGGGQRPAATRGRGPVAQPRGPAALVVSAAVGIPPRHTHTPGTARERAPRATPHAQHRTHPQGRTTTPSSAVAQRSAPTWVLCTTAATVAQAVAE